MGPFKGIRFKEEGLNTPCDLEKWNISVFPCSIISPNSPRRDEMTL